MFTRIAVGLSRQSSRLFSGSSLRFNQSFPTFKKTAFLCTSMAAAASKQPSSDFITPRKSQNDKRDYRVITLENEVKVILVSDPETDKSAAAMAVRVGHFADPDELPGLAHFCEHMLFLGTEKYPKEDEYHQWLKDHGGSDNAYTASHDTVYQFDVSKEHLEGTLDRFAQFFIAPLFTESATEREMNAVNSENQNNLQSDPHRMYQFDKSLADPKHPFHKFGTGNIDTLKNSVPESISVRDALLKFHKEYYSSSVMSLAIVGKETLDELQSYAVKMFSDIPNSHRKFPEYPAYPAVYAPGTFPKAYKLFPVKEKRQIVIGWPMPSVYSQFLEKPTSLLSYCLGDEGPGSILDALKKLGYATELWAGLDYNNPEFSFLRVTIKLTPDGLENWQRIVSIVYAYVEKMKKLTEKEWSAYFEERKAVRNMNFQFKGKEGPYRYATSLSEKMQRYPSDSILECMGGLFFNNDPGLTQKYLGFCRPDNGLVQLVSKDFESECTETERWYGTKYVEIPLSTDLLKSWTEISESGEDWDALSVPPPNPYIAENFDLFCDKKKGKKKKKTDEQKSDVKDPLSASESLMGEPSLNYSDDRCEIYFKMDDYFKQPKLGVSFKIISPVINADALTRSMSKLLASYITDILSDATYVFEEASLSYSFKFDGRNGFNLNFFGYNDKLPLLVETVLDRINHLKFDKDRFEANLEKHKRSIESFKKAKAYQQLDLMDNYLVTPESLSLKQMEDAVNSIDLDKFQKHFESVMNGPIFVRSLIYGNGDEKSSVPVYKDLISKHILSKSQKFDDFRAMEAARKGRIQVPADGQGRVLRFTNLNDDDNNSAISNDYFFTADTPEKFAVLRLFAHICQAPCFDQLRTKEQLGYIVWSFQDFIRGYLSFRVMIQSVVASPHKLDERIELFLKEFRNILSSMTEDQFKVNRDGVVNDLLEKTKSITQQNNRWWSEFNSGRFQFERHWNVAREVNRVTQEQVLAFYDEIVSESSKTRSKLSVQCFGKNDDHMKEYMDKLNESDSIFAEKDVPRLREEWGYHPFPYNNESPSAKL